MALRVFLPAPLALSGLNQVAKRSKDKKSRLLYFLRPLRVDSSTFSQAASKAGGANTSRVD
jgi:hypothetical protein